MSNRPAWLATLLSVAGLFVALVLSLSEATGAIPPCGGSSGCATVAESAYSHIGSLPVAYLGVFGYALLLCFSVGAASSSGARKGLVGLSAIGFIGSLAFTSISLFIIQATCLWCMASAAIMTALFGTSLALIGRPHEEPAGSLYAGALLSTAAAIGGAWMVSRSAHPRLVDTGVLATLSMAELVPADAPSEGDPDAPIILVEFADFACPACRDIYGRLQKQLSHTVGMRVVFRHFPQPQLAGHEASAYGALVSETANDRGRFWAFAEKAFTAPKPTATTYEDILASLQLGDRVARLMADRKEYHVSAVERDLRLAKKLQLKLTPAFIVLSPELPPQVCTNVELSSVLAKPQILKYLHRKPNSQP